MVELKQPIEVSRRKFVDPHRPLEEQEPRLETEQERLARVARQNLRPTTPGIDAPAHIARATATDSSVGDLMRTSRAAGLVKPMYVTDDDALAAFLHGASP